jgi:hypothetical protein
LQPWKGTDTLQVGNGENFRRNSAHRTSHRIGVVPITNQLYDSGNWSLFQILVARFYLL